MIEKALLVIFTGVLVGIVNSIAGGGTLIGYPLLLFYGLTAIGANATANIIAITGQITSSFGYRSHIKKVPVKYFWLLVPTFIGSVVGALILRNTPNSKFILIAPFLILVAILLFTFQPYLKQRIYRLPELTNHNNGPSVSIYIIVFLLSIYGGYFGAGFGLVMLAILSLSKLSNILQMNGLKNLCGVVVAAADILVLFNSNLINWRYGIAMAIGAGIGGYLGAKLAQKLPLNAIRYIVMVIGLATAIYMFSQAHIL